MKQSEIDALKLLAKKANDVYDMEKKRLIKSGISSQKRYVLLSTLKNDADKKHINYVKFATSEIKAELNKIIAADRPIKAAAARARSAWKQAKFNNKIK